VASAIFRPTPPGVNIIDPGVVVRGWRGIEGRVVISIAADPNTWTRGGVAGSDRRASFSLVVVVVPAFSPCPRPCPCPDPK